MGPQDFGPLAKVSSFQVHFSSALLAMHCIYRYFFLNGRSHSAKKHTIIPPPSSNNNLVKLKNEHAR